MEAIKDYRSHVPSRDGGVGKATLFQSTRLLLGLNCLEPGVEQRVHTTRVGRPAEWGPLRPRNRRRGIPCRCWSMSKTAAASPPWDRPAQGGVLPRLPRLIL